MDISFVTISISSAILLISIFTLFIHRKNKTINLHSFSLNRDARRSSSAVLYYVNSVEHKERYIIHLALFNPDSIGVVIQSLSVYRKTTYSYRFIPLLIFKSWDEIDGSRWWPTKNTTCYEVKSVHEEYENLYVDNMMDIMVSIPGYKDRELYKFQVKTNKNEHSITANIDIKQSYFPYRSTSYYNDKF